MLGLPHWYYPVAQTSLKVRDAPRPAVAPFSASDQSRKIDGKSTPVQVGNLPGNSEEGENEVMMDFFSGRQRHLKLSEFGRLFLFSVGEWSSGELHVLMHSHSNWMFLENG